MSMINTGTKIEAKVVCKSMHAVSRMTNPEAPPLEGFGDMAVRTLYWQELRAVREASNDQVGCPKLIYVIVGSTLSHLEPSSLDKMNPLVVASSKGGWHTCVGCIFYITSIRNQHFMYGVQYM